MALVVLQFPMKTLKIYNELASVFTLKLNPDTESSFYNYYIKRYLWQLRLAHILGAAFYGFAVLAESQFIKTDLLSEWLRIGIIIPSFIIGFLATYFLKVFYIKHYQLFGAYYVLITSLSFIFTGYTATGPDKYILYSGIIISLVFNYTFIRQSFVIASTTGITVLIIYYFSSGAFYGRYDFITHITIYITVANILGMFISYVIEFDSKRSYLLFMKTKQDALEIANSNISLEQAVQERTAELILAKEKAEKSDELKTRFLHNLSHEIRTPMNGIIGFSELLSDSSLSKESQIYYINIIKNSSKQLLRIINDIVDISELETKQVTPHNEMFNANEMLMELFSVFNLKASERNIAFYIKKDVEDNNSNIITDKTRVIKILSNLIENSLKYTVEGFVEVGVFKENENICFFVKDTGIGIDPKNKDLIFERFRQEDKENKFYEGLGLGLSIAKENAQLLNGDLTFASEKGKGTTFKLSIPYIKAKPDASTKKNIPTILKQKEVKILIAEDEEVNYLYIETILKDQAKDNYKIIHAKNGKESVDMFKSDGDIDMVLMDIKMPVMDGYEATKNIKALNKNIPVIAQTAYSSSYERKMAKQNGCDDFISKPINKNDFYKLINNYFS